MGTTRAQWLGRQPFTLALGAGFFGFFAHGGLIAALDERGLRPGRIVGVSAGALAGGLWASGLEVDVLRRELLALRRQEFWDPGLPLGGYLKGEKFGRRLRQLLGRQQRIEDASIPFAAVAHDVLGRAPVVLESGSLEVAIRASCSLPVMFRPVRHHGRWLVDGGVSDRPGLTALAPRERVLLHHLPSRSPWRAWYTPAAAAPLGSATRLKLVVPDLPRVSPGRLERGKTALEGALQHAREWLEEPV